MRRRIGIVAQNSVHRGTENPKGSGTSKESAVLAGGGATAVTTAEPNSQRGRENAGAGDKIEQVATGYMKPFLSMVATRAASMCETAGSEAEQLEIDELMSRISSMLEERQRTVALLRASRARVDRLAVSTCSDTLHFSTMTEDAALGASDSNTANNTTTGSSNMAQQQLAGDVVSAGGGRRNAAGENIELMGLEEGVLEPKVSTLIGAIAELPGPLKALLRELPEVASSLIRTVQSVETAVEMEESKTEAVLGRMPPAPLRKKAISGGGGSDKVGAGATAAAGDPGRLLPPPNVARAAVRATKMEQVRMRRTAGQGTAATARLGEIVRP